MNNENNELVDRVVSAYGSDHVAVKGRHTIPTDGLYDSAPCYRIKKTGLLGSTNWFLGAKTVLMLRGQSESTAAPFGQGKLDIHAPFTENESWECGTFSDNLSHIHCYDTAFNIPDAVQTVLESANNS